MTRPRIRSAVVSAAILSATACVYLWTTPVDWDYLQSLDPLQHIRSSSASTAFRPSCPPPKPDVDVTTVRMPDDAEYRLFNAPPPNSPDWGTVRPMLSLPEECLEAYVSTGATCGDPNALTEQFDFVWTWSNGSESLHRKAYLAYEESTLPIGAKSMANQAGRLKLFREHDELRHSFRSILQHFRPHVHKIHLVTGDLPVPNSSPELLTQQPRDIPSECHDTSTTPRLGQIPAWLNTSAVDGHVKIDVTHHSQYFTQYTDTVFNSLAIESQFPNLPNLHHNFIYMNDDFFFSADLIAADFYTKPFGTVFRVYPQRVIQPTSDRTPGGSMQPAETVALEWTSEFISRRFGFRHRPYPSHESKVVSTPIFRELAAMYADKLEESGRARVRSATGSKVTNVHMMALYLHFIVERSREAMLWSWAVGRLTQVYELDEEDWVETAWNEIGGITKGTTVSVKAKRRDTLTYRHLVDMLGEDDGAYAFKAYRFSSDDGYPYASLGTTGQSNWPDMKSIKNANPSAHPHYQCKIDRQRCFPTRDDLVAGYTPADFFVHIAFVDYECGDCMLAALVAESGELGLSALLADLPEDGPRLLTTFDEPPHLPLVQSFYDANFTVASVVPAGHDVRAFSIQLIHRYRYVIGRIFSGFSMLRNAEQAGKEFTRLDKDIDRGWMGVVCINDDIVKDAPEVDRQFRGWQEKHWPAKAEWEAY